MSRVILIAEIVDAPVPFRRVEGVVKILGKRGRDHLECETLPCEMPRSVVRKIGLECMNAKCSGGMTMQNANDGAKMQNEAAWNEREVKRYQWWMARVTVEVPDFSRPESPSGAARPRRARCAFDSAAEADDARPGSVWTRRNM